MTRIRVRELFVFNPEQLPADVEIDQVPLLSTEPPMELTLDQLHEYGHRYGQYERELSFWPYFNVSTVPQLSPFRYPGGKTWFMPIMSMWLGTYRSLDQFIEPFAGGGIASLTAASKPHAKIVTMVELDREVAAVWKTIINGDGVGLAERIASYQFEDAAVRELLQQSIEGLDTAELAFRTILRNRVSRAGILAPGSGLLRNGENLSKKRYKHTNEHNRDSTLTSAAVTPHYKGLSSRWYPLTLRRRILEIAAIRHRFKFLECDGLAVLEANLHRTGTVFFIDPPYMGTGRRKRLYTLDRLDHERLFWLVSRARGPFMMTYDDTKEVRGLARQYNLDTRVVVMRNAHNKTKRELVVANDFERWLGSHGVRGKEWSLLTLYPEDGVDSE